MPGRPSRRSRPSGGFPYLFIKVAVDDGVPPAFLAFVRVALGAAVLMALAWRAGALGTLRGRGRGRWLVLYAVFEIARSAGSKRSASSATKSGTAAMMIAASHAAVLLAGGR